MTYSKDFDSTFIIPPQGTKIGGRVIIQDWTKARVLADKYPVSNLVSVECNRISDQAGSGNATIKIADPDKSIYNSISDNAEIEVFLSEESPMTYGNKVWGGYVNGREFLAGEERILTITALEYLKSLTAKLTADSVDAGVNDFTAQDPGDVIVALMTNYQEDFTTDNVTTGSSNEFTGTFLSKSVYECIKQVCDTYNYIFYINLDRDLVVRPRITVVTTTDTITQGDNLRALTQKKNVEFLVNQVYVYGTGASATQIDQDSIDTNGTSQLKYVAPSLTTESDCQNFANAYISTWKDPIESIQCTCRLIASTDPFDTIYLDADGASLDGDYQVIEIKHSYGKKGLNTTLTLSKKITNLSISLGQILQRLSTVETTTYV